MKTLLTVLVWVLFAVLTFEAAIRAGPGYKWRMFNEITQWWAIITLAIFLINFWSEG